MSCPVISPPHSNQIPGEGLFFYRNLPIKWVRVVGVVVAIDEFFGLRAYTVDDSSGACIEAIIALPAPAPTATTEATVAPVGPITPFDHVDVGSVVDVKGALSVFREAKQIKVEKMACLRGTTEEVKLWGKRSTFLREVLQKPWTLDDKTVRRCRKDAERSEAEELRKRSRMKAAAAAASASRKARNHPRQARTREEAGEQQGRPTSDKDEPLDILAESKGKYSALGL